MKHHFVIILGVLILSSGLAAEEELSRALGFGGGMISGSGFSYRSITEGRGYQVNFGIVSYNNDTYDYDPIGERYWDSGVPYDLGTVYEYETGGRYTGGSLGLMYLKILHSNTRSRFYLFTGASMYFNLTSGVTVTEYAWEWVTDHYEYAEVSTSDRDSEFNGTYFAGAGLGMEYRLTDNVRISFELPITVRDDLSIFMYIPQAGIHYYYK